MSMHSEKQKADGELPGVSVEWGDPLRDGPTPTFDELLRQQDRQYPGLYAKVKAVMDGTSEGEDLTFRDIKALAEWNWMCGGSWMPDDSMEPPYGVFMDGLRGDCAAAMRDVHAPGDCCWFTCFAAMHAYLRDCFVNELRTTHLSRKQGEKDTTPNPTTR